MENAIELFVKANPTSFVNNPQIYGCLKDYNGTKQIATQLKT